MMLQSAGVSLSSETGSDPLSQFTPSGFELNNLALLQKNNNINNIPDIKCRVNVSIT